MAWGMVAVLSNLDLVMIPILNVMHVTGSEWSEPAFAIEAGLSESKSESEWEFGLRLKANELEMGFKWSFKLEKC